MTTRAWMCGVVSLGMVGCSADPLVPPTVDDDPSLPAVEWNDSRFHLVEEGADAGPPVIFLAGGPGNDFTYLERLATDCSGAWLGDHLPLVWWDQRGSGLSRRHDDALLRMDVFRRDLDGLVAHVDPDGVGVVLVGHSWGGMFAADYADRRPERVRGLVLIEPGELTQELLDASVSTVELPLTSEWINDFAWGQSFIAPEDHERLDFTALIAAKGAQPARQNREGAPIRRLGAAVVRRGVIGGFYPLDYDFTQTLRTHRGGHADQRSGRRSAAPAAGLLREPDPRGARRVGPHRCRVGGRVHQRGTDRRLRHASGGEAMSVVWIGVALAQSVPWSAETGRHQISVHTGFEDALLPVGVSGASQLGRGPVTLGGTWTVPTLRPDLRDQRGEVWGAVQVPWIGAWQARVAPSVAVISTQNDAYSAVSFEAGLGARIGWHGPRASLSAELGVNSTVATMLSTTRWAREVGGSPYRRGVRWIPAWGVEAGVNGAVMAGPVELGIRAGWDRRPAYNLAIPLVYATVSAGFRWGRNR